MQKLRLNLDQLTVDSFDTSAAAEKKGTVFGEQCTCPTACTCPGCPTCDHTACGQDSCNGSCHTCWHSCRTCGESCEICNTQYPCGPTDEATTCNPTVGIQHPCCPL